MIEEVVISIVEDDKSLRKAIRRLINSVGLCAEDFASAEDYLMVGRAQNSACLILDVRLPGISGLELQSRLAAANFRVPIIFISALGDGHLRTQALEAGAVDFLQKPFSEQALFSAINLSLVSQRNGQVIVPYQHQVI